MLEKRLVEQCHVLAGCTVYKHAVEDVHADNLVAQGIVVA